MKKYIYNIFNNKIEYYSLELILTIIFYILIFKSNMVNSLKFILVLIVSIGFSYFYEEHILKWIKRWKNKIK